MALAKTSTTLITNQTITASSSSTSTAGVDLTSAISCAVGFSLTFNASATAGATIEVYADADSALQTFTPAANDVPADSFEVAVSAGNTVTGMVQVTCAPKYIQIKIINNDTGQSITAAYGYVLVQTA